MLAMCESHQLYCPQLRSVRNEICVSEGEKALQQAQQALQQAQQISFQLARP